LLILAVALAASGSLATEPDTKPNILFLLADDLRADAIGPYGNSRIKTPQLDRLASHGQRFTRAVANFPVCVASRAEILTGCSCFRNGVFPGYSNSINDKLVTWPSALRQAGYRTVVIGKWHIEGRPSARGFERAAGLFAEGAGKAPQTLSFDSYGRKVTGYPGWVFQSEDGKYRDFDNGIGLTPETDQLIADAAIREIERADDRPFFLQVNFTAPHDPLIWPKGFADAYRPEQVHIPKNFMPVHAFDNGQLRNRDELLLPFPRTEQDIRRELAIYYAVIAHLDDQVGRVLRSLEKSGKSSNTIVIFSSDHGLAKGSHGLIGKVNLYEHTLNVPLIISGPRLAQNVVRNAQVQLADLYPTTCELAGIEVPATVEATSFAPVLRGHATQARKEVFGYVTGCQRMIRGDRYKLIEYPHANRRQLFDLEKDPDELNDMSTSAEAGAIVAGLEQRLRNWQQSVDDPALKNQAATP
jgi:arylsulfatase A-like enzyme